MTKEERKADVRAAYNALMKFYPFTLDDLDGEVWKPIPGYEEFYHASTFGRIKSFHHSKVKILKPICDKDGYLQIYFKKAGKKKRCKIHRVVATLFIQNFNSKPQVNHLDGCKTNNHVDNLEWATNAENQHHASKLGLTSSGENHYHAKFTNAQIEYIRANQDSLTVTALAKKFHVDKMTISDIQRGKIYKNANGLIRGSLRKFLSQEERNEIRAVHKPYDANYGTKALARKYGVDERTICAIINRQ